jgi:hypothetical protein
LAEGQIHRFLEQIRDQKDPGDVNPTDVSTPAQNPDHDGPRYGKLLGDGSRWRIDWFGQVYYPDRTQRSTQPSVVVHLSKLRGNPSTLADWLSPNVTDADQHTQSISIGALPHFAVGDIWLGGRRESSPDYQLETFTDLMIDSSTTSIIKAGLNPDDEGFLLPLSQHPWHRECTQSYCVRVNLGDGRRLIVPSIELIRFYFGSSSALITELFLPPFERKQFSTKNDYNMLRRHRHLVLGERMPGRSASDVSRLMTPTGWSCAAQLGASILRQANSKEKIYPIFSFPIEGKTNLVASGKWVSYGKRERDTFVVFNLRSCAAPFPFRSLSYQMAKGSNARSRERISANAQTDSIQVKRSSAQATSGKVVDQDGNKRLKKRERNFHMNRKFPDLENKTTWKSKSIDSTAQGRIVMRRTDGDVDEAAGEQSGSRRVRSVDFLEAMAVDGGKRAQVPAFLKDVVADLMNLKDTKIRVLTASDEDGWSVPVPLIADDDGVIDLRIFVNNDGAEMRLRRISLFELLSQRGRSQLVALETINKQASIAGLQESEFSHQDILQTLRLSCEKLVALCHLQRQPPDL